LSAPVPLRLDLLGLGKIAVSHLNACARCPDVRVTAVGTRDPVRGVALLRELGLRPVPPTNPCGRAGR